MTRRKWLQLGALAMAGQVRALDAATAVNAGSFLVAVPDDWAETAIIEKIPLAPLYSKDDWKAYQADKTNILKPGYGNRPQHWALRFPRARLPGVAFDAKEAGGNPVAPQILIHKADEWGLALTDGIHEELSAKKVVQKLRGELDQWKIQDLPHGSPVFIDAELTFICLKKPLKFHGGRGIRMLAQWTAEEELVQRGQLHYLFLGLSDDGTCQIIATFPLDLRGLPKCETKPFDRYEAEAKKWLEDHAIGFTPNLEMLDEIIGSLVVKKWQ